MNRYGVAVAVAAVAAVSAGVFAWRLERMEAVAERALGARDIAERALLLAVGPGPALRFLERAEAGERYTPESVHLLGDLCRPVCVDPPPPGADCVRCCYVGEDGDYRAWPPPGR